METVPDEDLGKTALAHAAPVVHGAGVTREHVREEGAVVDAGLQQHGVRVLVAVVVRRVLVRLQDLDARAVDSSPASGQVGHALETVDYLLHRRAGGKKNLLLLQVADGHDKAVCDLPDLRPLAQLEELPNLGLGLIAAEDVQAVISWSIVVVSLGPRRPVTLGWRGCP